MLHRKTPLRPKKRLNKISPKKKEKLELYQIAKDFVDERDKHRCRHPGCNRQSTSHHHIIFRSAGGVDEVYNLVSLCTEHHTGEESPHNKREWREYWERWARQRYPRYWRGVGNL